MSNRHVLVLRKTSACYDPDVQSAMQPSRCFLVCLLTSFHSYNPESENCCLLLMAGIYRIEAESLAFDTGRSNLQPNDQVTKLQLHGPCSSDPASSALAI